MLNRKGSIVALGPVDCIMETIRNDVGSLLWRCKRGKNYAVRPLEQLMHSAAMKSGLEEHISSAPAFFRYPMVSDRMQNYLNI